MGIRKKRKALFPRGITRKNKQILQKAGKNVKKSSYFINKNVIKS